MNLSYSDAPAHHIFCLLGPTDPETQTLPEVLCVVQVCLEGEISKTSVHEGEWVNIFIKKCILKGKKRKTFVGFYSKEFLNYAKMRPGASGDIRLPVL